MKTELIYLSDMSCLSNDAVVLDVDSTGEKSRVILDRSVFYPQGGGQPSDTGQIVGRNGVLNVACASHEDGALWHSGIMEWGALRRGDIVKVTADGASRRLHSRIHSAGEVICACVRDLGHSWPVVSAMHYPGSSRIGYDVWLEPGKREALIEALVHKLSSTLAEGGAVSISSTSDRTEARQLCGYNPEHIPSDQPIRIVHVGKSFARPCMGTHVASFGDIGPIIIRGLKVKKGQTLIAYDVE